MLDAGASLDYRTFTGSTVLLNAVGNEDSDPNVLRLILGEIQVNGSPEEFCLILNYKRKSTTLKWKGINYVARTLYRTGISKSMLMTIFDQIWNNTIESCSITEVMIRDCEYSSENGADPYVENDLGMNAFDICNNVGPFPSVNKALLEHSNKFS